MNEGIAIPCIFNKATTTVDGGWRISFDCGENSGDQIALLSMLRGESLYLVVMKTPPEDINKKPEQLTRG